MTERPIGWVGIVRLGLIQASLGAVVALATSTLNRIMVIELALPAIVPGALVALHYAVQVLRPRMGYGADVGGRQTPWIVGGMAMLASGGVCAATATAWMGTNLGCGMALAALGFLLVGIGVGAAGTSLLVLMAKRVEAGRRAAAASILWLMMIAGIAITAIVAGRLLDPFSPARLVAVTGCVCAATLLVSCLAIRNIEGPAHLPASGSAAPGFFTALREIWSEPRARRFAQFVFVSMLAYSAQELIIEPFAGAVFALTPGQSTSLTGLQHVGVLTGMLVVALVGSRTGGMRVRSMQFSTVGGCLGSAAAILVLACSRMIGTAFPLRIVIVALGMANGVFAVSAIGSMMGLAGAGRSSREGVRMGLWGAAQAVAFGLGGLLGPGASDIARAVLGSPIAAYSAVFVGEAALFLVAACLAAGVFRDAADRASPDAQPIGKIRAAQPG